MPENPAFEMRVFANPFPGACQVRQCPYVAPQQSRCNDHEYCRNTLTDLIGYACQALFTAKHDKHVEYAGGRAFAG
jgi:hypothetical protein